MAKADVLHQFTHVITTLQQHRHQLRGDAEFVAADLVQHALGHMGEGDDVVQAEESGRAFDGVGGTEDGVDGVCVVRGLFDAQQRFFHAFEQVTGFGDEGLQGVVKIHGVIAPGGSARCRQRSLPGRTTPGSPEPPDCGR